MTYTYIHKPITVSALQWKGKSDKEMYNFLTDGDDNKQANTEKTHNETLNESFTIYIKDNFSFYMVYREKEDGENIDRLIIKTATCIEYNIELGDYVVRDEKGEYSILSETEFLNKFETFSEYFDRYKNQNI